jgi:lysophospholipid acyltransferase (LPLAT)-like uncharacterized protein
MQLAKRFLKSDLLQKALISCASLYFRLIIRTNRWQHDYDPEARALIESGQSFIGTFWHGRMMLMFKARLSPGPFHILISGHRDGRLIAEAIRPFGVNTVIGSSSKSSLSALRDLKTVLGRDEPVAITPDGPRGPRMRVKPGIIKIAQKTGLPIVPVTGAARRRRILKSWDRFHFVFPFTRVILLAGTPMHIPRDADERTLEFLRMALEDNLNNLTAVADQRMEHPLVMPDAPGTKPKGRRQ